jgi:two-component SAPR family response regulator
MNAEIRKHLFSLSERAAHELERYIKIHDLKFDRTNFIDIYNAKMQRMEEIRSSYDDMISALQILVRDIEEKSIESDYSFFLGSYICEIMSTISLYQQRLRIIKFHQINGHRIKGFLSLLRNRRDHIKHQKAYLKYGVKLTALWGIMKNT